MSHDHIHIDLGKADGSGERRLFYAMLLTGGFMVVEIGAGLVTGSLALIADAGHMFGDFVALVLAWAASRLSAKSADLRRSFGYHRFQVLAAFVNGISLLVLAMWILLTALRRLYVGDAEILAAPMLVVAIIGLIVNFVVFRLLTDGAHDNMNMRSAALHVWGDMLGSIAAIIASLVIIYTGWMPADAVLSIVVAGVILRSAFAIVLQSGHILLEGTPEEVDPAQVSAQLMQRIPSLIDVHHVHIWSLTDERPVLTLHARVAESVDHDTIMHDIHGALESLFGVSHATVQLEYGACIDERKVE